MNYTDFFAQLFVLTFGVFAALVLAFRIIWPKIENYLLKINAINQSKLLTKENLQLRYTAYERLILLVHRIAPEQIMLRNHDPQLSMGQFKQILITEVESEFNHNFTQQLYVSDAAWTVVKDLKINTISLLRNTANALPKEATLDQYVGLVLKHVNELDVNPYDAAQLLLKNELTA
ncbi:hypothetical protein FAZ19_04975 [Sphingobacterium alkalisoli]|uniref:DUF4760 domain-containing protein n=1 Tax=Sphingobacterium alkalisoli TaxID=1874115 RepID=A0A4U0H9T1_9SPHI|nr:hypothetical protein [Sphingobacterium alkalisoli]TJY68611.1 hypothetical protein FAZ19_04975 [Sphingobacterium alkalisoli]GGH05326.1 hypothetical protein GCM10011418_01420 [Sphingobacterium alkalisoli]